VLARRRAFYHPAKERRETERGAFVNGALRFVLPTAAPRPGSYKIPEWGQRPTQSGLYTCFNFGKLDLPGTVLNGLLTGAAGQINEITRAGRDAARAAAGTGVYALGAPRETEFGLRIAF
jgi:hypothetical protein